MKTTLQNWECVLQIVLISKEKKKKKHITCYIQVMCLKKFHQKDHLNVRR